MDRVDWYFRQLVTEGEMDFAFDQVQERIEQAVSQGEMAFDGVITNAFPSEASPPDLTVNVNGPALLYTPDGKRVQWNDASVNVDLSEDDFGTSTEVSTPGNARWISLFAEFDEAFDDLRTDGFGSPVYWKRLGSYRLFVVMGDESVTPIKPALRSDAILLADFYRVYGQTTIENTDHDLERRQDYYRNLNNFRSDIWGGSARAVITNLHDDFNLFAEDLDSSSPYPAGASLVGVATYNDSPPSGTDLGWIAGTTVEQALRDLIDQLVESSPESGADRIGYTPYSWIAADSVAAAINEIVDDLSSTAGGASGATRIGIEAINTAPIGGLPFGIISDEELWTALDQHFSDVANTSVANEGAKRLGAAARTGVIVSLPSPATLTQGPISTQLKELIDYIETIRNTPFSASAVSFVPHDYVTSTNVQDAIEELIDDLQLTTASLSGARQIGVETGSVGSPNSGVPTYSYGSASDLRSILENINTEINKRLAYDFTGPRIPISGPLYIGDTDQYIHLNTPGPPVLSRWMQYSANSVAYLYDRTNQRWEWQHGSFGGVPMTLNPFGGLHIDTGSSGPFYPGLDIGVDQSTYGTFVPRAIRLGGVDGGGQWPFKIQETGIEVSMYGGNPTGNYWGIRMDSDRFEFWAGGLLRWYYDVSDSALLNNVSGASIGTQTTTWPSVWANRLYGRENLVTPANQQDLSARHWNNCVLAWGSVDSAGNLNVIHYNVASATRNGPGSYTITLDQAVRAQSCPIVTPTTIATDTIATASFVGNPSTTLNVATFDASSGAQIDHAFQFAIIGQPGSL